MPIPLGILAVAGAGAGAAGSYDLLETTVLSSSASSVTFSSLGSYSDYKHLQIRGALVDTSTFSTILARFNSDSGSNYSRHNLQGSGSAVTSSAQTSQTSILTGFADTTVSPLVLDLLDFSSTNKNTTLRALAGGFSTTRINLFSGAWLNTAAVTSVEIINNGSNFASGTRVSLYGIK